MTKTITLNTFRAVSRMEEDMMRAVMPRTSANDTAPLTSDILPAKTERRTWRAGKLVAPLTFTMKEVARG